MKYLASIIFAILMAFSVPAMAQWHGGGGGWHGGGGVWHGGGGWHGGGVWHGIGPLHNPVWNRGWGWTGGRYYAPGTNTCWFWNGAAWQWNC